MNTIRCGLRILVGSVALGGAMILHDKAHEISDTAIGVGDTTRIVSEPEQTGPRIPQEDDGDFFGSDPREQLKKPEVNARLKEAIDYDQLAVLIALAGGALVIGGVYPLSAALGIRLFLPDWVRKRMEALDKTTEHSSEHREPNDAGTSSTGIDARSNGSIGVCSGKADRTVDEPTAKAATPETSHRPDGPATHVVVEGRSDARA